MTLLANRTAVRASVDTIVIDLDLCACWIKLTSLAKAFLTWFIKSNGKMAILTWCVKLTDVLKLR